jgi:hypothetical protein
MHGEAPQRNLPVSDWSGPFLRDVIHCEVKQLEDCLVIAKRSLGFEAVDLGLHEQARKAVEKVGPVAVLSSSLLDLQIVAEIAG